LEFIYKRALCNSCKNVGFNVAIEYSSESLILHNDVRFSTVGLKLTFIPKTLPACIRHQQRVQMFN